MEFHYFELNQVKKFIQNTFIKNIFFLILYIYIKSQYNAFDNLSFNI